MDAKDLQAHINQLVLDNDIDALKNILDKHTIDSTTIEEILSKTLTHTAVLRKHNDAFKILFPYYMKYKEIDNIQKILYETLYHAIIANNIHIVQIFIQQLPHIFDSHILTNLIAMKDKSVIQMVLDDKVIGHTDTALNTMIRLCANCGYDSLLSLLLQHWKKIHAADVYIDEKAINAAIACQSIETVKQLIPFTKISSDILDTVIYSRNDRDIFNLILDHCEEPVYKMRLLIKAGMREDDTFLKELLKAERIQRIIRQIPEEYLFSPKNAEYFQETVSRFLDKESVTTHCKNNYVDDSKNIHDDSKNIHDDSKNIHDDSKNMEKEKVKDKLIIKKRVLNGLDIDTSTTQPNPKKKKRSWNA